MEHKGLPVAGYKPQSEENVILVNENKVLEEMCLRQIDKMLRQNSESRPLGTVPKFDSRMIALANTHIQEAFMWLNRAVFQPTRVVLPEDLGKPKNF